MREPLPKGRPGISMPGGWGARFGAGRSAGPAFRGLIPLGGADVILDVFVFLHFLTVCFDCQSPEFGFDSDVVVPIDIPIDSFFDLGY